jgi:hypothetical protein
MEGPYESATQQVRLMDKIVGYTKTPRDTKVAGNSFCIEFSIFICKTTTFTYEIRNLDPLTKTLLLSIITNTIFPILYMENIANYGALSTTFYIGF